MKFFKRMSPWLLLLIIPALLLMIWGVGIWLYAGSLETPRYSVVEKKNEYEIRQYEPILVAQVVVNATTNNSAMNGGFMQLADYIFGNNTRSDSIAMTTPVIDQPGQAIAMTAPVIDQSTADQRTITFTIPEKWTVDTLPQPNNDNVKIVEWPAEKKAVRRFMTLSTFEDSTREKAAARLLSALAADNVEHEGDITFAFYNPPWTPFFLRRNEVMVTVEQ